MHIMIIFIRELPHPFDTEFSQGCKPITKTVAPEKEADYIKLRFEPPPDSR